MIKAIIIDDNQKNIDYLKKMIKEYCPLVTILANGKNINDALIYIEKYNPDIVFLDIELENELGFDLFQKISNPEFEVIFTTAHEKYALQAIKASCLEYLIKPIDYRELIKAINKFDRQKQLVLNQKRFEILLTNVSGNTQTLHKIALPVNDGYRFINVSDIIYCEADLNYTKVITINDGNFLSSKTLKEFEEMLNPTFFFRCHKSWILNLNYIKKYSRSEGSRVQMINDQWIDISVRKKEEFLKFFEK